MASRRRSLAFVMDPIGSIDIQADTTTLISRAAGAAGAGGDDHSASPSISDDARFVAFASDANNLTTANDVTNVFRRTIGLDPPVNLTSPQLTGQPVKGQPLGCSDGAWTDGTITRQWRRGGAAIAGATGAGYTPVDADVGQILDCLVTATNADGSASGATNPTLVSEPIQGEPGTLQLFAVLFKNKEKGRAGKKKAIRFISSDSGEAELTATRKNTEISASSTLDEAGAHKLKLKLFTKTSKSSGATSSKKKPIKKGSYALALTVTGSDGQTVTDSAKLKVKKKKKKKKR